jgi:hypothetical protein
MHLTNPINPTNSMNQQPNTPNPSFLRYRDPYHLLPFIQGDKANALGVSPDDRNAACGHTNDSSLAANEDEVMVVVYLLDTHDVSIASSRLYVDDAASSPPLGTIGSYVGSLSVTVFSH